MALDQLAIYNGALQLIGARRLTSLNDDVETRYELDAIWENLPQDYCGELVKPLFASKLVKLDSPTTSTEHDYDSVHALPSTYVDIISLHKDPKLDQTVERFVRDGSTILCDESTVYLRYIDSALLVAVDSWSQSFARVVIAYMAFELAERINTDAVEKMLTIFDQRLQIAIASNQTDEPAQRPVPSAQNDAKLTVFNNALITARQKRLTSLDDDSDIRYKLDVVWAGNPALHCAELVKPSFALKTVKLDTSTSSNEHGFSNVFQLPEGYVDIHSLHLDANLDQPVERYIIDGDAIACEHDTVYLRYIDADAINDLSKWSSSFTRIVYTYIAVEIAEQVGEADVISAVNQLYQQRLATVTTLNSDDEPVIRPFDSGTSDFKLNIFNNALMAAGMPRLKSLTDESNARYNLDSLWALNPQRYCAELIKPRFAATTVQLDTSTASNSHDLDNVFTLPSDFIEIVGVYSDSRLDQPIERYIRDGNTIACEYGTVYVRYINSTALNDYNNWTPSFTRVVFTYLAKQLVPGELIDQQFEMVVSKSLQSESVDEPAKRSTAPTVALTPEWLTIYNDALLILGEDHIVNTFDDSRRRSILDVCINSGLVGSILEDIGWHWATTSMRITADPNLETEWGYTYAHHLPTNLHRFDGVWYDEYMQTPIKRYTDEGGVLMCDVDEIYIKYVSSDWLITPELWKPSFKRYVAAKMAYDTMNRFPNADKNTVTMIHEQRERDIRAIDAQQSPPHVLTRGTWTRMRTVGGRNRGRP